MKSIKWELGHSNVDIYGFNTVVFIEGDSEEIAIPIIAESLNHDLAEKGIKLINVKGKSKAKKLEQYLAYLKDSGTLPFVVADGDKKLKEKTQDWIGSGILQKDHCRIWNQEFEDLFPIDVIVSSLKELKYKDITEDKLELQKNNNSIVHAIRKVIHENNQYALDKPALAEIMAKKVCEENRIPEEISELINQIINTTEINYQ